MTQKHRQKNRITKLAAVLIVISGLFAFGAGSAQNGVQELEQGISEKEKQLQEIQQEISGLQKEISSKQNEVASLKNEVGIFDLQIRQTESQIAARQLEINILSDEIAQTEIAIREKEEEIERKKRYLGESLRLVYEFDSVTPLELTLGNSTFSEFLDQVAYAENLQDQTRELLKEVRLLKAQLEEKKISLETKLSDQKTAIDQLEIARGELERQRSQKEYLLAITRGQERQYQNLLADAAQKQGQVEDEIYDLEIEIRKRLGKKELPPIEGVLQWPMSGILTQGYGNTGFRSLGYNFHNGLDIAAPAGTLVRAAGDGIVHATGSGQAAYGNWVVLKHTISKDGKILNIMTLYAHMQSIKAVTGQTVRAGDIIGYEGNTGNTTRLLYGPERGYHLHFTVFDEEGFGIQGGAYQHIYGPYSIPYGLTYNPMDFLP